MDEWYYARGGVQSGPMSIESLRERLAADGNLVEALVWREGFSSWRPAPEVEELIPRRAVAPVAPVGQPTPTPTVTTDMPNAEDLEVKSSAKKPLGWFVSAVTLMIGLSLSKMLGPSFWLPAFIVGATWILLSKWKVAPWMVPVLAIVIGHTGWTAIGVGALVTRDTAISELVVSLMDVVIVGGLAFWALRARSTGSIVAILAYEIFGLGIDLASASGQPPPSLRVAGTMHLILWMGGIITAIYAMIKNKQQNQTEALLRSS